MPHVITITGGPCAGKTTVLDALRETFGKRILIMPEVPTILLANGFPRPGLDVPASDEWFRSFQRAVLPLQENMEAQYGVMAEAKQAELLLVDRGLIDGAAYMPGGEAAYLEAFGLNKAEVYARYEMVIYLESVAACRPELWDSLKETNPTRYETLDEAQERDRRLREVWGAHSNWQLVSGEHGIEHVLAETLKLVTPYLP